MRFAGTLKSWNDDRGFGFIEPAQDGEELFVHIKSFPAGTGRPKLGQALSFEVELGPNGKKRARAIEYPVRGRGGRPPASESPAPWTLARAAALPAFVVVYACVVWRWGFDPPVLFGYLGLSVVAFVAYGMDKAAAVSGQWRMAEQTLHLFGLLGGWPGALLAQQLFRHKTTKRNFVVVFWVTVALNTAALVAWHAGVIPRPWVAGAAGVLTSA